MAEDNPLTEELIKELNEISQLDPEEQKKKLPDFLKKLSPEQMEFLKKNKGGGCVFCGIVEGKIPTKKVYEDEYVVAVLDINPANKGHVLLIPKVHSEILSLMKDVGHLFNVANRISSVVFEITEAEGTNIFVANGLAAGQKIPHVAVNIIPRFKDDKVQFGWESKKVEEADLDELARKIGEKLRPMVSEKEEIEDIVHNLISEEKRIP